MVHLTHLFSVDECKMLTLNYSTNLKGLPLMFAFIGSLAVGFKLETKDT